MPLNCTFSPQNAPGAFAAKFNCVRMPAMA